MEQSRFVAEVAGEIGRGSSSSSSEATTTTTTTLLGVVVVASLQPQPPQGGVERTGNGEREGRG
jgi:hypothetical protein